MLDPIARVLGRRQEGGDRGAGERGLRGWFRWGRRSLGSDDSGPKSPTASTQGQEMTAVSQRDQVTSAPTSPLSGGDGASNSPPPAEHHPAHPIPESPEPAARRGDIGIARPPSQAEQTQTPAHPPAATDLEDQDPAQGTKPGGWFWQKQSWKGLQSKLAVVIVSGLLLAISLAICMT